MRDESVGTVDAAHRYAVVTAEKTEATFEDHAHRFTEELLFFIAQATALHQ